MNLSTPRIKPIPEVIINRIAAGEVVERPASIVKELVENSLDAKATKIIVEVMDAGKSLIRITDNGIGITREDLPLTIAPHATSKLDSSYDLWDILTYGFRGEALASIANISKLSITSRHINAQETYKITYKAPNSSIAPNVKIDGTIIEIKDLFYSVPARLKFLKTDKTELAHITKTFQMLALANHQVDFTLFSNGAKILNYGKTISQKERFLAIIGVNHEDDIFDFEEVIELYKITAIASIPNLNGAYSSNIRTFINNRPIYDMYINKAIKNAYSNLIPEKCYPFCALFLEVPLKEVDINVHPAKSEVRFIDPLKLQNAITSAFNKHLHKYANKSAFSFPQALQKLNYPVYSGSGPIGPRAANSNPFYPANKTTNRGIYEVREEPAPYIATTPTVQEKVDLGTPIFQFFKRYIISRNQESIFIIDQHAAHERIIYEQLKKSFFDDQVKSQMIAPSIIIEIKDIDPKEFFKHLPYLKSLGLLIDPIQDNCICVKGTPSILGEIDPQILVEEIIENIKTYSQDSVLEENIRKTLARISCHNSIRSGKDLSIEEMDSLLRQIEQNDHTAQCNHGRPSYCKLSISDLDKLFDR